MRPEDLPLKTKLVQLAEECAELAQASLKMIRAIDGDTPINEIDAREHLLEEIADVKLCADIITSADDDKAIRAIYANKYRRWKGRLNNGGTAGTSESGDRDDQRGVNSDRQRVQCI